MLSMFRLQEAGDTIVEVLIAAAVISLVLVSAYATSNHSTRATQDAQEHSQGLQLIQTQIEFMRSKGAPTAAPLCFDATGGSSNASCDYNSDGSTYSGTEPKYHVTINAVGGGVYNIQANWDSILGSTAGAQANINVYYKPGS